MAASNPFASVGQSQTAFNPFANMAASAPKAGNNIFQSTPNTSSPSSATATNPFASAQPTKSNPFLSGNTANPKPPAAPAFASTPKPSGTPPALHHTKNNATHKNGSSSQKGVQPGLTRSQVKSQVQGPQSEFATRIYKQLAKDGIKSPAWPKDPDALRQKAVMDELRQGYRVYREKVRKSLMKADLVDDPDKRRRLDEALPFKGICEDMCPEWERIQRIVENGLWGPEGYEENGTRVPIPNKMIKRLARSAAGQEAALPMDVRSPAACRRTLDYLVDELIAFDDRLPTYHHFVWDRTRAIRIDLSMQTPSMTPDEIKDEIYCLETIARFHATSAHLLARSWFMYKDYSEQQEVEQLSKSLMTLKQRYKDCADMGIVCENEAEFLAYYIVFFGWDSSLKETVESWGEEIYGTEDIQTAMCVIEAMQNTSMLHGPLKPESSTELALNAASIFFSIVASPQISYTMACIAEIHFGPIRQAILKTIVKSYSRPKGAPKDITAEFLRRQLRFDAEDDAVAFVELHGLEFKSENGVRYVHIEQRQQLKRPRIKQAFSHDIVECKRNERSFPDIIHETIYEDPKATNGREVDDDDSLFVRAPKEASGVSEHVVATDSDLEDMETPAAAISQTNSSSSPFGATVNAQTPGFGTSSGSSAFSGFGKVDTSASATASALTPQTAFGNFSAKADSPKPTDMSEGAKKVTFGETSVKFIESRTDGNKGPSPGVFSFLKGNIDGADSTPTAPKASNSSWFPSNPSEPTIASGDKESQSVFSRASAASGTGFKFPDNGQQKASVGLPASGLPLFGAQKSSVTPTAAPILQPPHTGNAGTLPPPSESISFPATTTPKASLGVDLFSGNSTLGATPVAPPLFPGGSTTVPPFQTAQGSTTSTTSSGAPAVVSKPSRKDQLDNFAKWFVCGDRGLLEDLEEWAVETVLRDVWTNFVTMEDERQRKEEDEKSWAEARKFRTYSLSVTYFYRWLEIFRKRRAISRIRSEREKLLQYRTPENVAKRKAVDQESRKRNRDEVVGLIQEKARERAAGERSSRSSVASHDSVRDALLGSGILKGVRNPEAAAQEVAMDGGSETRGGLLPSETLYRQESKRREKHGLPPLTRLQQPHIYKEGSKAAMLKAQFSGKDTTSVSTGSFRNSTLSSSFRSSLGFNSSRIGKAKKSRVSDPYWRLKANGLIQMPNGEYLHESLALPMLREGKRFRGLGDFGLPPSASASPAASAAGDAVFDDDNISPGLQEPLRSRVSPSPSIASNISSKRKRASYHQGDIEDDDLAAYRSEASASIRKRARSNGSVSNEPDLLTQMQSLLKDVQAEGNKLKTR